MRFFLTRFLATGLVFLPLLAGAQDAPAPTVIPVTPGMNPAGAASPDIKDIRPLIFFFHPLFWLEIFLGLLLLVGLAYLLWQGFKRTGLLSEKSPYELALERLEKARTLLQVEQPVPYAQAVSDAVREYIVHRFQLPLTRQTTEEALRELEADAALLDQEKKELLRSFLEACDLVKFAQYQPSQAELEAVQERAVRFLLATKPGKPSQEKGGS